MKNTALIMLMIFAFLGCKSNVLMKNVLEDMSVSNNEISADGQSTVDIIVVLSNKTSSDRRNVVFSTDGGSLVGSNNNRHTVSAEFLGGKLQAKATLRAPLTAGSIKVTAQPEFDTKQDFVLTKEIMAIVSQPVSIKLNPSRFGIGANFINDVKISGVLRASNNKSVSRGRSVLFEDVLLNRANALGRFRNVQSITGDSSSVRAIYGASSHPIGTVIKIRATVLDDQGRRTLVADSIFLTVNQ